MEEFRLSIELYGDADNFGLLVITDNRKQAWGKLPTENYPIDDATPEKVGNFIAEYLKKNCT